MVTASRSSDVLPMSRMLATLRRSRGSTGLGALAAIGAVMVSAVLVTGCAGSRSAEHLAPSVQVDRNEAERAGGLGPSDLESEPAEA